jgi:hypothetical protein
MALLLVLLLPAAASAYSSWKHSSASACASCHDNASDFGDVDNLDCTEACHAGFNVPRPGATQTCWTCHAPGQDTTPLQQQTGCVGVCHTYSGGGQFTTDITPHGSTPHYASTIKNCRTCHTTLGAGASHHDFVNQVAPTAASCSSCHPQPPATPVDGAANGHGDLGTGVAAADCQHCHVGMGTTHPAAAQLVVPRLTAVATRTVGSPGDITVAGTLKRGTTGIANAQGWVQWKGPSDLDWDPTHQLPVITGATGAYTATVTAPAVGTVFRVVFEGIESGGVVVRPALSGVATTLTLRVAPATVRLGKKVTASGTIAPARTGANVTLTIQRRSATGRWVKITTKRAALLADGSFTTTYKPTRKGTWRMQGKALAAGDFAGDLSPWRTFRVR